MRRPQCVCSPLLTIGVLFCSQLFVLECRNSDGSQEFLFDLQPSLNHVAQVASDVTFHCVNRNYGNVDGRKDEMPLENVGLLFTRQGPSLPADPSSDVQFLRQTWRNGTTVAVSLSNVSVNWHSGWYWCGCTFDAGGQRALNNRATRLIVGFPPEASDMNFYWFDRRHFESTVLPSLDRIVEATGVPQDLGGTVSLKLMHARSSNTLASLIACSCWCDSTGNCNWGEWSPRIFDNKYSYYMRVQLQLCNKLDWCRTHSYEFDMRDMERPDPVRKLALHFEPHQLSISWEAPTTEMPGNQEYRYEVSLSDGRRLATNATRVSLPVRPDTAYSATVRCRPRHFSGHWSDNSSDSGRSGEWLPCNPRPGGAFLVPPDTLVFPASDRSCSNGRVIYYRIFDLISNLSQVIDSVSSSFVSVRLNFTVGLRAQKSLSRRFRFGIFAATSAGGNSSLPAEISIGPVDGACDPSDGPWDRVVTCSYTANGTSPIDDCRELSHVTKLPVTSSFRNVTWRVRRGVACPVASPVQEGSPWWTLGAVLIIPMASIFIVIGCQSSTPVPPADMRTYVSEPDMQLGETPGSSPATCSTCDPGTSESAALQPRSVAPNLLSLSAAGQAVPQSGYCYRDWV